MDKKYLDMLNTMNADKDVKGKKLIKKLIWINTVQPKYEVGDIVAVTDRSYYFFGKPAVGIIGKVSEVLFYTTDELVGYRVDVTLDNGIKRISTHMCVNEDKLVEKNGAADMVNMITGKSEVAEAISC